MDNIPPLFRQDAGYVKFYTHLNRRDKKFFHSISAEYARKGSTDEECVNNYINNFSLLVSEKELRYTAMYIKEIRRRHKF